MMDMNLHAIATFPRFSADELTMTRRSSKIAHTRQLVHPFQSFADSRTWGGGNGVGTGCWFRHSRSVTWHITSTVLSLIHHCRHSPPLQTTTIHAHTHAHTCTHTRVQMQKQTRLNNHSFIHLLKHKK